ncbi:MAG: hypothetical protein K5640_06660 [Treponema sp.]|nr:hypothetical protein [Treponema sp.]
MTQEERELCIKYAPEIYFDKNDPFSIRKVGCTIFNRSGKSQSFPGSPLRRREIELKPKNAAFAIEYAYYMDYDIQHLYELEHIWVYVDSEGKVCGCEGSFHGKILNEMTSLFPICEEDETHVHIFSQPGKHAFMPRPELFELYPNPDWCCYEGAGKGGLDLPEMFEDTVQVQITEKLQQKVKAYIKKRFAFKPSWDFKPVTISEILYTSWEELSKEIPHLVQQELELIGVN